MEWIQKRRKELNYSQEALARELQLAGFDVIRSTVSHWETKKVTPPFDDPDFVVALAKILKTDAMTILQLAGYPINTNHTEISERMARLVDMMPQDKQVLALKLVEQLMD